jgi:hypothetical protein
LLELYESNEKNINNNYKILELECQKNKIITKKEKLLELNIEGNLSNDEWSIRNNDYNEKLTIINENIDLLKKIRQTCSDNNCFEEIINKKIKEKEIKNKLIELLLNKIVVSKINNDKENMKLKIFFNFSKIFFKKELQKAIISNTEELMKKEYEFRRGYNTTSTRRYIVKYQVILYANC